MWQNRMCNKHVTNIILKGNGTFSPSKKYIYNIDKLYSIEMLAFVVTCERVTGKNDSINNGKTRLSIKFNVPSWTCTFPHTTTTITNKQKVPVLLTWTPMMLKLSSVMYYVLQRFSPMVLHAESVELFQFYWVACSLS